MLARESAIITCIWQTQNQEEQRESFIIKKWWKAQECSNWKLLARWSAGRLTRSRTSYVVRLESVFWLSLVPPELQTETTKKNREAERHWPSSDCFGLIAAEVAVWLPGLHVAEVVDENSVVVYDLSTAHLYIQSHTFTDCCWTPASVACLWL